mmetsp:Transcript_30474/g.90304  ORF Transcript_30474/g.90304 Transcript_30474/m.90304 type:complete len:450 (-) Transcript_30474:110-1459(-)|eukprot:CAMPEP_0175507390 /NCGR_PEP_ID=MMETSP0096-20121207/9834_1 /TAXON_ID=311494 /ORGANISM="Alexandrium monilatum, Strain CCMP3105" /LENGTH=449 /DNA_ID=CAMNT_0016809505 /DNA_START=33 /DNA_END=1382 /DNA_ORIENTATION=-
MAVPLQPADKDVVHTPVCPGQPRLCIRYRNVVRQLSVDYGETALPSPDYDYAVPTNLAHRASGSREVVGPFSSIREGLDFDYHGCYTVERQKLQDILLGDVIGCGTRKDYPWAIFTAGAMGAGKGHVMDWLCAEGYFPLPDIVTVDPDCFRVELPEWRGYLERDRATAGAMTHRESGYMVEIAQAAAMDLFKNVWIDGSLRDGEWYTEVIQRMRKDRPHYRIAIFHVSAPWEVVLARSAARAKKTGREVPEAELRDSFERVPQSVELLSPLADFTAHIENVDVPRLTSMSIMGDPVATFSGDWREVRDRFAILPTLQKVRAEPEKSRSFVEGLIGAHPLLVFSKTYCSYCKRVKKLLAEEFGAAALHTVELDTMTLERASSGEHLVVEGDVGVAVQLELLRMTGQRSVPQVFLAGRHVGGWTSVQELQQQGKLRHLLKSTVHGHLACKH